jgi:hypothetical protein
MHGVVDVHAMGILVRGENKLARTINRGIHFSMNALGWLSTCSNTK